MANDKVTTHGKFDEVAKLTQRLKDETILFEKDNELEPASREALDQICTRIARIVIGDENHPKHWADIAGFAMAKLETLKQQEEAKKPERLKHFDPPTGEIERNIRSLVAREIPNRNGDAS